MVVKHHTAIRFVLGHDLVQPLLVKVAHQWQSKCDTAPILTAKLVMLKHFIAPALHLLFDQFNVNAHIGLPWCNGLQICPAFVNLQRHQRRMVVGAFKSGVQVVSFYLLLIECH